MNYLRQGSDQESYIQSDKLATLPPRWPKHRASSRRCPGRSPRVSSSKNLVKEKNHPAATQQAPSGESPSPTQQSRGTVWPLCPAILPCFPATGKRLCKESRPHKRRPVSKSYSKTNCKVKVPLAPPDLCRPSHLFQKDLCEAWYPVWFHACTKEPNPVQAIHHWDLSLTLGKFALMKACGPGALSQADLAQGKAAK